MGAHAVPYDFAPWLDMLESDWSDDPLLYAWLADLPIDRREWVQTIGRLAATLWKDTADFVERTENLPRLSGKGPYDNDPQNIVLPAETWETLAAVHGSGLWQEDLEERARYAAVYLLNQNGEAGVACSVACTDGLARVLRATDTSGPGQEILDSLHRATPDDWLHGAQFVTEIQAGSDARANAVRAEGPDEAGMFALHGQKWFCSNATADWWLVTARVDAAIGLFLVPRDQPGYTLERLKDKLGTRALPTAEILLRGARGWPVGPVDSGLRTMVEHVLVTSRVHNVVAAAAFARRAVREAAAYARFRTAFGRTLEEFPLIADSLQRMVAAADASQAAAFRLVDLWVASRSPSASEATRAWARCLVSMAKAVLTRRLPSLVHEAMMVLGGNGIEERFTALPRLYRDAAILETWEGPYTLLLDQAWRDARHLAAQDPGDLARWGAQEALLDGLPDLLAQPPGPAWRAWCDAAVDGFAQWALTDLQPAG